MSITYTLFVTFFTFSGVLAQEAKTYKIRTVAFYNLENLFDTVNDSLTFDDDRTRMERIIGPLNAITIKFTICPRYCRK